MEQELKEEWLTRTGRLIIRYAPSAKTESRDAQWAYVGRYLFYYSGKQYIAEWLSSSSQRHFYFTERAKTQIIPL